jgi:hypothetical protein
MPPPMGSPTTGNTIGMVRVAWSIALEPDTPWARMTSDPDAASSVACLRSDAGLVVLSAGGLFSLLAGTGGDSVGPKGALSKIIGWPFGETLATPLRQGSCAGHLRS